MFLSRNKDITAAIPPEGELLLVCARTHMGPEKAERVRQLLREPIDWEYLLRAALRHGMMPLLYWHVSSICPEAVPKGDLDRLRIQFRANAEHNLLLTGELLKLLSLLDADGIPAIPMRGPVLAASVYGNLSLRQFIDLDILVHQQDVPMATDILISQGYRPWPYLRGERDPAHREPYRAFAFVREDGRIAVDLHWGVTTSYFWFPLDPESLWERLKRLPFANTTVRNFLPEDLLLILCAHASKHGWARLGWICDVAELCRVHQGMDWERVMEEARSLRSERMLFLGLLLASDLLGTSLPEQVVQRMQTTPVIQSLAAQARKYLFSDNNGPFQDFVTDFFPLGTMERLQDKVRYSLHIVHEQMSPNKEDWALLSLPASLSFLYYVLRPLRLIRDHGLNLVQCLFKEHLRGTRRS